MRKNNFNLFSKAREYLRINRWVELICTMFIAFATVRGCFIQQSMVDISKNLENIEKQNTEHSIAASRAEFRPYLVFWLKPGGSIEVKDGVFFFKYDNQEKLYLHFNLLNKGKIPAKNIKLEYDSSWGDSSGKVYSIQSNVEIENPDGVGHLSSDGMANIMATFVPEVNISNIKNNNLVKRIEIILRAVYQGEPEIKSDDYNSSVVLIFERTEEDSHIGFYLKKAKEEYDR